MFSTEQFMALEERIASEGYNPAPTKYGLWRWVTQSQPMRNTAAAIDRALEKVPVG